MTAKVCRNSSNDWRYFAGAMGLFVIGVSVYSETWELIALPVMLCAPFAAALFYIAVIELLKYLNRTLKQKLRTWLMTDQ